MNLRRAKRTTTLIARAEGEAMKRIISRVAALAVFVGTGLACGVIDARAQSGNQASSQSLLQTVLKRGKLIIGTRSSAIAFSFKDEKGELVGFDIDVGRALGELMFKDPKKVEFVVLPGASDRVPAIIAGRVDAIMSSFSPYPDRVQVIDFSVPYAISATTFVVRANSPFQKNVDLSGKTVMARQGADVPIMVNKATRGATIVQFPETSDALLAFRQGRGDAFLYELGAALYMTRTLRDNNFRAIEDREHPMGLSAVAIGVRQGDQVWLNYLNWLLYDLKANEVLQAIHKKWFGSDAVAPNWVRQPL
jgi:polar amino acid transport system substrate-binding protein